MIELASIDWAAAISAPDAGELPSSDGERRMPRLAASLADQAPVSLGEAITGIKGDQSAESHQLARDEDRYRILSVT